MKREAYSKRLKKAFPTKLEKEVEKVIQILPLENHRIKWINGELLELDNLISSDENKVLLNSEQLTIPYRLYFEEPRKGLEEGLSELEREILNCIYLRHANGYCRERRLKLLLNSKNDFVIPFTLQLLGEYVFEILELLDQHLKEPYLKFYQSFLAENPSYWQTTKSRVGSYWDIYYRNQSRDFKEYLGYKMIQKLEGNGN